MFNGVGISGNNESELMELGLVSRASVLMELVLMNLGALVLIEL